MSLIHPICVEFLTAWTSPAFSVISHSEAMITCYHSHRFGPGGAYLAVSMSVGLSQHISSLHTCQ